MQRLLHRIIYSWIPFAVFTAVNFGTVAFWLILMPAAATQDKSLSLPFWFVTTGLLLTLCWVPVFIAFLCPEITPYTHKVWRVQTGREKL